MTLNQITTDEIAKLKWRCRRGMLELDLILSRFLSNHWNALTRDEQMIFERLLHEPDPNLYAWFMGYETVEDESFKHMVTLIQRYGKP
ncbi:MAG: succinate dehydrogenase assembly factor 2 [Legionellaceae bacterium]|nr:succinate dehydrogenase assembly factor 2 [Legionellaceae bacterium]